MKLYTAPGSRGLRVTWTLEELGLEYEIEALPMPARKRAPHFFGINPLGTVPALVHNGVTMTESVAISHFLAAHHETNDLLISVDEPDYPLFLDFLYHSDATLTFPQTVYIRYVIAEADRGLSEAGRLYADWFIARLKKMQQRLDGREYLCANRFTIADIANAYPLFLAGKIGLGDKIPKDLARWLDKLMAREGFKQALAREAVAKRELEEAYHG